MTTKQLVLSQFKHKTMWDSCELQRKCGPGTRTRISDLKAAGINIYNFFLPDLKRSDRKRKYFYTLITDKKLIDFKNCCLINQGMNDNRCGKCNRRLTDPKSIRRGFGPECIKQVDPRQLPLELYPERKSIWPLFLTSIIHWITSWKSIHMADSV